MGFQRAFQSKCSVCRSLQHGVKNAKILDAASRGESKAPLAGGGYSAAKALGQRLAEIASDRLAAFWVAEQTQVAESTRRMREAKFRRARDKNDAKRRREIDLRRDASAAAHHVLHEMVRRAMAIAEKDAKLLAQMRASDERRAQREKTQRAAKAEAEAARARVAAAAAPSRGGGGGSATTTMGDDDASRPSSSMSARDYGGELEAQAAAAQLARVQAAEAERAAIVIQSRARSMKDRKRVAEMRREKSDLESAAAKIQANFKGMKARREALPLARKEAEERQAAVVKIQARVRGVAARRLHEDTKRKQLEVNAIFLRAALQSRRVDLRRQAIADAETDLNVAMERLRDAVKPYADAQAAIRDGLAREDVVLLKRMLKTAPDPDIDAILKTTAAMLGRGVKCYRTEWRALLDLTCDLSGEICARWGGGAR